MGRSSTYSDSIADRICERLAEGEPLNVICKDDGMPGEATVRLWDKTDRHGFSARYAQAREIGYARLADEIIQIADDGSNDWIKRHHGENAGYEVNGEHVSRSRLRFEARKWLLSKMLPKTFGDRTTTDVNITHAAKDLSDDAIAALIGGGGSSQGTPTSSED